MKNVYLFIFMIFAGTICAQNVVTGKIMDDVDPLIGATVIIKGTTNGTITDADGNFKLMTDATSGMLVVSYVGYETMNMAFGGDAGMDLGTVVMGTSAFGLGEVVVTGVMDIVQDRRTPVAVSTITAQEIQAKGGNVEFPELMKSTPSIYVANQAGGYGDSEVFTRGFDQTNTAFLLNGQPINGMEDGKMYWSNWSGMSDVANAIQVQRGLGSSKLAISSVGGTTNIIMKATEQTKGGSVGFLYGNDNYMKATASYSTGMLNDKFGITILATHWQGDGWAEGTQGQGQNYFLSAGYKVNDRNSINFLITGAPQWHDQNFTKSISSHFNDAGEFNIKYNNNWGLRNGEYQTLRRNYYHKPVANLNWDFKINDKSKFSAVAYASWGRGGGTGDRGDRDNRFFTDEGYYDWDRIEQANRDSMGAAEWIIRASVNNHSWYGSVLNYETALSDNLTLSLGGDLRTYHGSHFRQVVDLLGAPSFTQRGSARFPDGREVSQTFEANPWSALSNYADLDQQIHYSNDETINYAGAFGQLEYTDDKISAYFQGALSNQSHVRFELRNEVEATEASEKVNNLGYNVKGGMSYSFDESNIAFVNAGYYQRQPFHDNIYLNFGNTVNPVTVPEKILGLEAGYKFSNQNFAANFNVYRTSWKDRATTRTLDPGIELPNGDTLNSEGFRNTLQNQLHQGVELDFSYKIMRDLKLKGYASVGDWAYEGTLNSQFYNEDRDLIDESIGDDVDGVKVGGAAQTSFGLGLDYNITKDLRLDIDYNYYANLYSNIGVGTESLQLPSFGILDFGASYNFKLANNQLLTLRANVFNLTGTEYISRAWTAIEADTDDANNWNGVNKSNRVAFGKTTTWNVSAKYSF